MVSCFKVWHVEEDGSANLRITALRPIVRRYLPTIVQIVFNLVFVSFIQSILLYALTVPIYSMLLTSKFEDKAMSGDIFFYVLELLLIFTEGIADQQQWGMYNILPSATLLYYLNSNLMHRFSKR